MTEFTTGTLEKTVAFAFSFDKKSLAIVLSVFLKLNVIPHLFMRIWIKQVSILKRKKFQNQEI